MTMKIGVYLCQCGGNISKVVDLEKTKKFVENKDIEIVQIHSNMCSGAGQKLITNDIENLGLDKIVVAACSPHFHEKTFRAAMEKAGLNPHVLEIANLREHVSWPLKKQPEVATKKANDLVNIAIEKVSLNYPLEQKSFKMENRVLVIGGGIAGIQASLDLADAGKQVTLIEKEPSIGGKMALLTKTFPTEDCAACILSPKMAAIAAHPNIKLLTNTMVTNTSGHRLHFEIEAETKPKFINPNIDMDECLGCFQCQMECPVDYPDDWELGIVNRKAIYVPASLAIPYQYMIDPNSCLHFTEDSCSICADICPQKAIDFEQKPEKLKFTVDNIIVATGYDTIDPNIKPMFGYDKYKNVVTGMEMERIVDHLNEKPPPRDIGEKIAFIQCVGSRDEQVGNEYCSRVCCMYATKLASLVKQDRPESDIYIFYTDMRAYGKGFEEYYKRAQEMGIKYIRGKVAEVNQDPETNNLVLKAEDTLSRQIIESEFDLIVLSNGLQPNKSTEFIIDSLKLAKSPDGFIKEAHPKYKPVDTDIEGVFIAGTAQGPKDIPDTVVQAGAAAARVIGTLSKGEFDVDPVLAFVETDVCDGCEKCINACPKHALKMNSGKAEVDEALCVGGGSCISSCPVQAIDLHDFTNSQMSASVFASLEHKKKDEHRIILFADNASTYRLADTIGVKKMTYSHEVYIIRTPSGSRISPNLMLQAFINGADAIMIGDNISKSSSFPWSKDISLENIKAVNNKLEKAGIKGDRLKYYEFNSSMLKEFVIEADKMADYVQQLSKITDEELNRLKETI